MGAESATQVHDVLAPEPKPGTVVILDNLAADREAAATEAPGRQGPVPASADKT